MEPKSAGMRKDTKASSRSIDYWQVMDIIITFKDCSQTALSLISFPVGPGGKLHGVHGVVYAVTGFLVEAAVSLDFPWCHLVIAVLEAAFVVAADAVHAEAFRVS